ncbi:hypothetical protein TI03_04170, partial [Achromatium sp. WMS1]
LEKISTVVNIRHTAHDDWYGKFSQLTLIQANQHYRNLEINLHWPAAEMAKPQLTLTLPETQLKNLTASITALPIAKEIHSTLIGLAPQGKLHDFVLRLTVPEKNNLSFASLQWHLSGRINGFANNPWNKIPGVENIDLNIHTNANDGNIEVAANNLQIHAPHIFRAPLPTLQLMGIFNWQVKSDGTIQISSDNINITNQDVAINNQLKLQIPPKQAPIHMELQSDFTRGNVAATHHYLPVGVMKKPLIAWLDQALVAGDLISGKVLLHGPVEEFPFRRQEGRFEAELHLKAVTLKYEKNWPPLTQAMGSIRFLGPGLIMDLQ